MAQSPDADTPTVAMSPAELDQARRTSMAAERTWLEEHWLTAGNLPGPRDRATN